MAKRFVGLSLETSTLKALDSFRGDIPRSRIIERLLQERLKLESPSSQLAGVGDGE
jgi:hypothetical protein